MTKPLYFWYHLGNTIILIGELEFYCQQCLQGVFLGAIYVIEKCVSSQYGNQICFNFNNCPDLASIFLITPLPPTPKFVCCGQLTFSI